MEADLEIKKMLLMKVAIVALASTLGKSQAHELKINKLCALVNPVVILLATGGYQKLEEKAKNRLSRNNLSFHASCRESLSCETAWRRPKELHGQRP